MKIEENEKGIIFPYIFTSAIREIENMKQELAHTFNCYK
jgi:hypothetical protein